MTQRDYNSALNLARAEGKEEGLQEGIAQGEAKGEAKARLATAKGMLSEDIDIAIISRVTGLSEGQIRAL